MDNATRLFLEKGFDSVTVEDICTATGVSKRTFFNYIPSKEVAAIGPGPRAPSEEEIACFLATRHDNVLEVVFDLVVDLFGIQDHQDDSFQRELLRRRKEIRVRHQDLALQHFARFHQARAELENLLTDYYDRWPDTQQLDASPQTEATTVVGTLIAAVFQGARAWHELDGAQAADFRACCHQALTNIFLLQGGRTI
nr:TetR/AcrR family transcriptional regulator [Corynebacterium pacaense]